MWFYLNIVFYLAFVLLVLKLAIKLSTGWCTSNVCLVGKTIIITGANTGIGYETAADFAKRGARVILACRNPNKGSTAQDQIVRDTDNPNVMFKQLDLTSLKSVREFADDINRTEKRLDILVNNAGVAVTGPELTEDGLLHVMQVNYFGHFLLTNLLLDLMKKTPNSRILNTSSVSALFALPVDTTKLNLYWSLYLFSDYFVYARSKLCIQLFTMELAERLKNTSVTAYAVNPGLVETGIFRGMPLVLRKITLGTIHFFFKNVIEGAQTTVYCGVTKGIEHLSGRYFEDCHVVSTYWTAKRDSHLSKELWEASEKLVHLNV